MSFCESLFEGFAELILRFTFAFTTSMICAGLAESIAAHQNKIMRTSRQLQTVSHIPTCTHIFSEADTRIHHDDIKAAAIAITFEILFLSAGILYVLIEGPTSALTRPSAVCVMVALLATPALLLWLHLALACRRRHRNRMAVAWNVEDVIADDSKTTCRVGSNERTALLPSEKGPGGGKERRVEDNQLRQGCSSKKGVDAADERVQEDGRSNSCTPRVSWTGSELPFVWLLG